MAVPDQSKGGNGKNCSSSSFRVMLILVIIVSTALRSIHLYVEELETERRESSNTLTVQRRVVLNSLGSCQGGLKGGDCYQHSVRLLNYCALSAPEGAEGNAFVSASDYSLVHVSLTIRHGDRTSIHSIPGSSVTHTTKASILDMRATHHVPRMDSFKVVPIDDASDTKAAKDKFRVDVSSTLDVDSLFRKSDRELPPGQLTSIGFMQHVHLGQMLNKAYDSLISSIGSHTEVYVRSTNYARTIQSAAALMSTLVPNVGGPSAPIEILSHPSESNEIMHGIGLASSSHRVSSVTGEEVRVGKCSKAVTLQQRQKESYVVSDHVDNSIEELFGLAASDRFITDLVDGVLPGYCHGDPLPCKLGTAGWGAKSCLNNELVGDMMVDADRAYCERFTGSHGGLNATRLSIYPFLKEIVESLETAASGKSPVKLNIYSGHDTVIAPVLAALGVYQDHDLCKWPQYASRIAFELWKHASRGDGKYFVRVIFNGQDVSAMIPSCAADMEVQSAGNGILSRLVSAESLPGAATSGNKIGKSGMCSLAAFAKQVNDLIAPYSSVEQACK